MAVMELRWEPYARYRMTVCQRFISQDQVGCTLSLIDISGFLRSLVNLNFVWSNYQILSSPLILCVL